MMKKAGIFTTMAVLAAVFTAGCGQAKLPESFSEEEVKKEAENPSRFLTRGIMPD